MNINDAFPSNWLKATDLKGMAHKVIITAVAMEDVGDGEKPVLRFLNHEKGLVLNKTNALLIAASHGEEMDSWVSKEIEIYPDKTSFQGRVVDCIRVRSSGDVPVAPEGDEIPF